MTEEELNTALYQKAFDEQERFRRVLLNLPSDRLLEKAYEYIIREDILLSLEYEYSAPKRASRPHELCMHSA